MKHKSPKPLAYKIWNYFALFSVSLMVLLWFLQIFFLQTFYDSMKVRQVEKMGRKIAENFSSDRVEEFVDTVSFRQGVFVYVVRDDGTIIAGNDRFARSRNRNMSTRSIPIRKENVGKAYIETSGFMHMRSVAYLTQAPNNSGIYLYIVTPLERVDNTTQVLQEQLIIVTIISILISLVLAYFMARKLSKPIYDITESAKILEMGNYDVKLQQSGYKEINELSLALVNAAEALSKSDELRRDLIANVSHDLRTPLTIIKSYAEMIRDLSGDDKDKRTAHTNVIVDEANRLTLLVNDILDLSKLEAGENMFENKEFSLTDAVVVTIESFKPFVDDGYCMEIDLTDDLYVSGDFQKIKSVIYNLILNSINYTGEDKKIYISLKKVDGKAVFSVKDTGSGISKEEIPKVWERYYRASNSHKRAIIGSGIGLSIVKTILLAHNAEYGVESEIGKGSIFWFALKLSQ